MVTELSEMEQREKAKAAELLRLFNFGSPMSRRMFVQAMLEEHRSLQQDFFDLICAMLHGWAQEKRCDARNRMAVDISREIVAAHPRVAP